MSEQPSTIQPTSDEKLWAILSYLLAPWVSLIIMLFVKEKAESPFIRYHHIQALGWGVVGLVISLLTVGFCGIIWLIGSIYFAVKANNGEYVVIPVLTDLMKKQGWL
mgnify:FL=1